MGASLEILDKKARKDQDLFAESGPRYVISCKPENEARILKLTQDAGIRVSAKGQVKSGVLEIAEYAQLDLENSYQKWQNGLKTLI